MSKKFPFFKQLDLMDCGPTCLKMMAAFYGKHFSLDYLREKSSITKEGVSMGGISDAADTIGFQSVVILANYAMLEEEIPLPCIAHWRQRHFIVIHKISSRKVSVADPAFGLIEYSKEEFLKGWLQNSRQDGDSEGYILALEPSSDFYEMEDVEDRKSGFKTLIPFVKPHRKLIFQLLVGLFIGSLIQLIFPFLTQSIVDIGISQNNLKFINVILIGQLVLFVSQITTGAIRSWLLLHITSRINVALLSSFLIKLMKLPIAFFDSKNIGDLLQRIQDNTRIQTFLSSQTLNVLFSSFSIIIYSIVLLYYSVPVFLILLVCTVANFLWIAAFMKGRTKLDYKRFDQAAGSQSSMIQLLNGMQEIKLNNSEKRRRWEWELIQARLFKLSLKGLSLSQFQDVGGNFILQLMSILITFIAARQVINGDFSLGTMLSIQFIIGQLNVPISSFIAFSQSYQDAKISLRRLDEIYSKKNEVEETQRNIDYLPVQKDIIFKNAFFKYGASTSAWVLEDINLSIPEGRVTAIVGPSGSGKTTLLKLILKFHGLNGGSLNIGNTNLAHYNSEFWRKNVSVVMQDGYIFADTIARNITESNSEYAVDKKRLQEAVRIANIEEFIDGLPNGYNTKIGDSGMTISGGQRQRILIARAVYKNPSFLLFDEATSALDANNEMVIMKNLEEFYKSKTVVIVAHRLSTVKNADQIIVLDKGRIIEQGCHEALTTKRGSYYSLIKNQLELGN